jgi:hypothetical protein
MDRLPLTRSRSVFVSTLTFTSFAVATKLSIHLFGPHPQARACTKLHSQTYSLFSSLFLLLILASLFSPALDRLARYTFHLSKTYEYVDILLVLACGGSINLHFAIHHLTTPYLTLFRVLPEQPVSQGSQLFVGLNALHPILLYAYLGSWTAGASVKRVLPWTQRVQLLGGVLWEVV